VHLSNVVDTDDVDKKEVDQRSINDITEFGMKNDRLDDDVVNVFDLDDLGQPVQQTRISLQHDINGDNGGNKANFKTELSDPLAVAVPRQLISSSLSRSDDDRETASVVDDFKLSNLDRRKQLGSRPLGEQGKYINHKGNRRARRNSDDSASGDEKNTKWKRMARVSTIKESH